MTALAPVAAKPRARDLAVFSVPAIPMAAMNLSLAVFLPQFYATHTAIPLTVIGYIFMMVRLADLVFDPLLGIAIDRTATRIGRFRPWMLAGAPTVMAGAWLAYFLPATADALIGVFGGYSLVTVTQFSWAAVLTGSASERSRIYGWIQAAAVLGMLLILGILPVIGHYVSGRQDMLVRGMGTFIMMVTPAAVLFATAVSREPPQAALVEVPSVGRAVLDYGRVLARPAVIRVMATTLLLGLASGVTSALFMFFSWAKGFSSEQSTIFLILYFVGAFASAQLWAPLSTRVPKPKVLATLCAYGSVVLCFGLFLPNGAFVWAGIGQLMLGITYSGNMVLLKSIVADAAEAAKDDLMEDFTGRLFAIYMCVTKASLAIAVGLMFLILQTIGYVPKAGNANAPEAIRNLELCFILIPAVLIAAGGLVIVSGARLRRSAGAPETLVTKEPGL